MQITSLFEYFAAVTDLLTGVLNYIPTLFGWLPAEILAIFVSLIAIAAVYRIMGWGG